MDTHKTVDRLVWEKEKKHAESELIKLATEDIKRFIESCRAHGFKLGMRFGFWAGMLVALIIYLIAK